MNLEAEIVRRYLDGMSAPDIERLMGVDRHKVMEVLRDSGTPMRSRGEAVKLARSKNLKDPQERLERRRVNQSRWQRDHRLVLNARRRQRRVEVPEVREQEAEKRREQRSVHRESKTAWRRRFPEKFKAEKARRRAALRGAEGYVAPQEWAGRLEEFGNRCAYCGKDLRNRPTQDHVVPLSRGGAHRIDNIVPACVSCNSRKGNRLLG